MRLRGLGGLPARFFILHSSFRKKKERLTAFPFFVRANVFYLRRRYAANANAKAPKIAAQVAGSGIIALV